MSTTDTPELMSVGNFAAHLGFARSYGHQLRDAGRLVLTDDGRVRVAESIARVRDTEDPAKGGVKARHAAARAAAAEGQPAAGDDAEEGADAPGGGYNYQASKAKREHFAAERELTAHRKEAGELIEVTEHTAAMARVGSAVRAGLEAWAALLPPQLAGRDEGAMRATIAEQVELLLNELTAQMYAQAREHEGERA